MYRQRLVPVLSLLLCLTACRQQPAPALRQAPPQEHHWRGKVVLGSPSLTAGLPGDGPLTLAEIKSWLADAKNHEPLEFALPIGLRGAEGQVHVPADNPLTRAKIELGRQLFFDRRLSRHAAISCGDCHHPKRNYTNFIGMPYAIRNPAVTFNRLLSRRQFWDGNAASLEDQPMTPITNPHEMKTTPEACVARIRSVEGYRVQFDAIFGRVDFDGVCRALACFVRALVTGPSSWDYDRLLREYEGKDLGTLAAEDHELYERVRAGAEANPMSAAARRGEALFFSDRAQCHWCHSGANLTDESFHNVGAGTNQPTPDLGRYLVTKQETDKGAFKTPTLRNVAGTWPYMHDGRFETLEEVVDWFSRRAKQGGAKTGTVAFSAEHAPGRSGKRPPSPFSRREPLDLSDAEKSDLVEFLRSLTGPLPVVETGRLPE